MGNFSIDQLRVQVLQLESSSQSKSWHFFEYISVCGTYAEQTNWGEHGMTPQYHS